MFLGIFPRPERLNSELSFLGYVEGPSPRDPGTGKFAKTHSLTDVRLFDLLVLVGSRYCDKEGLVS